MHTSRYRLRVALSESEGMGFQHLRSAERARCPCSMRPGTSEALRWSDGGLAGADGAVLEAHLKRISGKATPYR